MANDDQTFDVRTIDRRLREGEVDRDNYEEHLENLPDAADKAREVEAEFVEGVLEDDEEELLEEPEDAEEEPEDAEEEPEDAEEQTEDD